MAKGAGERGPFAIVARVAGMGDLAGEVQAKTKRMGPQKKKGIKANDGKSSTPQEVEQRRLLGESGTAAEVNRIRLNRTEPRQVSRPEASADGFSTPVLCRFGLTTLNSRLSTLRHVPRPLWRTVP